MSPSHHTANQNDGVAGWTVDFDFDQNLDFVIYGNKHKEYIEDNKPLSLNQPTSGQDPTVTGPCVDLKGVDSDQSQLYTKIPLLTHILSVAWASESSEGHGTLLGHPSRKRSGDKAMLGWTYSCYPCGEGMYGFVTSYTMSFSLCSSPLRKMVINSGKEGPQQIYELGSSIELMQQGLRSCLARHARGVKGLIVCSSTRKFSWSLSKMTRGFQPHKSASKRHARSADFAICMEFIERRRVNVKFTSSEVGKMRAAHVKRCYLPKRLGQINFPL
ncbi:hypothetical protein FNV43_RR07354 [Rhamnella rubrinervis]|uniref:Uncharacterized protein n=1 Tax=Rhamnella rubrinervis TaxID=2594499 RepID=A0A8K0HGD5_9ROSA|nr:hypothetical protein FNV43_RR07354 [Rhamnella rubrinervis]